MKNNSLSKIERISDPVLEQKITKGHQELNEQAVKDARHYADRNQPGISDQNIQPYIGNIKAGYEKLGAEIFIALQPSVNFPEGKLDIDNYKEKDRKLDEKIREKEDENRQDKYDLGDFNSHDIPARVKWALISTLIITIGDVIYNTKAFQVTGENLLFSLLISLALSFGIFLFSHVTALLIKKFIKKWQKWSVGIGSIILVGGVSYALAIFRSSYLALHDININPGFFVIINLFLFIISVLVSYFLLPSWEELKENKSKLQIYKRIQRRSKEIVAINEEKLKNKLVLDEINKIRLRIISYATYYGDLINKMYVETVEKFKSTNLTSRTDRKIPACFHQPIPEANISESNLPFLIKSKS